MNLLVQPLKGLILPLMVWAVSKAFMVVANCMITNFHLPKSPMMMEAAAFAGYDFLMKAYKEAVNEKYRFFTYGDAMLII